MKITKDTIIADLLREHPNAVPVLMQHGMPCVGCPASQMETLEEASQVHGINVDDVIKSLEKNL